jgi:benzodiazapine receptor
MSEPVNPYTMNQPTINQPTAQPDANLSLPIRVVGLICWLLICFAAATSGIFISVGDWYATLNKPSWNPPSWLFGPVWSVLYCMMAVAAWLVWCKGGWREQRIPLGLFLLQLALNMMWTPLFFGLHMPGLAFAEMSILWITLSLTIKAFWKVSPFAGATLLPYLAWITFAAVLNFTIWRLNA